MEYKGFFKSVNEEPKNDEWIEVFASDWFKDYWAFYAYISLKNYQKDIEAINELIHKLNWRDGDVYVELINHSDGLHDLYHWLYEKGYFTHHDALNPENWRKWFQTRTREGITLFFFLGCYAWKLRSSKESLQSLLPLKGISSKSPQKSI